MTLTATIRRLTGVSVDAVSDVDVAAALAQHRAYQHEAHVEMLTMVTGAVRRGTVDVWGRLEPATQASTHTVLVDTLGATPPGTWTLDENGDLAFDADQAGTGTLLLSAYSYDVHSAAVEVIDQRLGQLAEEYDVTLGEQSFRRSQAVVQLEQRRMVLAAGRLAVAVQRERHDDPITFERVTSRRRGRL